MSNGPQHPVIDGMKRCTACDQSLPAESSFAKKRNGSYKSECNECLRRRSLQNYEETKERRREYARQYWANLPPEGRQRYYEQQRARRAADPERHRRYDLIKKLRSHGIEIEDYEKLLNAQGGLCAICREMPRTKRGFHVDHDHVSGRVRGILCHSCNTSLGGFREDVESLRRAIEYLERPTVDRLDPPRS